MPVVASSKDRAVDPDISTIAALVIGGLAV